MTTLLRSIYSTVFIWVMLGCMTQKQQSQQAINRQQKAQSKTVRSTGLVSQRSREAVKSGRISESANKSIQTYITSQQDSIRFDSLAMVKINTELSGIDEKANPEALKAVVAKANLIMTESNRRLRAFDRRTAVIVGFLNSETFSKSELNTLFGTGDYRLTTEQFNQGRQLFTPIVEKIFLFSNKYKGGFKSMEGEIIVTGYSDATPIESGSRLYNDLVQKLNRDNRIRNPSKADLNRKLSELRAEAVKGIIDDIIRDRKNENNFLKMAVKTLGRGEEIPPFLTSNVTRDDQRRRIVTFYWVVLPVL